MVQLGKDKKVKPVLSSRHGTVFGFTFSGNGTRFQCASAAARTLDHNHLKQALASTKSSKFRRNLNHYGIQNLSKRLAPAGNQHIPQQFSVRKCIAHKFLGRAALRSHNSNFENLQSCILQSGALNCSN